jgi:hypothetical protein
MNTFLPYPDFVRSAACLDRARLGKQRVETMQILNSLFKPDNEVKGWGRHPARDMWKGYEQALVLYGIAICTEWIGRGYKDTCLGKISKYLDHRVGVQMPPWFGYAPFHLSHKSNLTRKDAAWYGPQWPEVPADLEYFWPTKSELFKK